MSATLATCTSWWSKPALATAVAQLARRGAQRRRDPTSCAGQRDAASAGLRQNVLLFLDKQLVGVLSFNQIEPQNKTAYIGYWIDEEHQARAAFPFITGLYPPLCRQRAGAPVCDQMPGGEHPQQR